MLLFDIFEPWLLYYPGPKYYFHSVQIGQNMIYSNSLKICEIAYPKPSFEVDCPSYKTE